MEKKIYTLLAFFICFNVLSQIKFEKGYLINNSDERIECFIKNIDWNDNPKEIEYKMQLNDVVQTGKIDALKEFEIYKGVKYVRAKVSVDISSENLNFLSSKKAPDFREDTIFLKVLVGGKYSLYSYKGLYGVRYFFKVENDSIEQLIFKKYYNVDDELMVLENSFFKQQIFNKLNCETITKKKIEKLRYSEDDLISVFNESNRCNESNAEVFKVIDKKNKTKRDVFNFNLKLSFNRVNVVMEDGKYNKNYEYGDKICLSGGIEGEYIFPFNRNKWALAIEPSYLGYKSEIVLTDVQNVSGNKLNSTMNFSSVRVPISLRYYSFINSNLKLFYNFSFVSVYDLKGKVINKRDDGSVFEEFGISSNNHYAYGLGVKYRNKYSVEIRKFTKNNVLDFVYRNGYNENFSVIFGLSLF